MKRINIFDDKYIHFFGYDDETIEYLHDILFGLGFTFKNLNTQEAKKEVLILIKELLKIDLIYVHHWGENHEEMSKKTLSLNETIDYIDSIWFEGADYPDFYRMIRLGYQKWYMDKMNSLDYTPFETEWKWFVKNNIGDLEKWIEEHRPKKG